MKSKIGKRALAILLCMVIVLGGTEYMRAGSEDETETATPATSEEEIVLSEDGEQQAAEGETDDTEGTDASADTQEQAGSEETGSESTGSADSTEAESKSDASAENGTSENNAASENGETKNETASTDTEKKEETAAQTTDTEKTTEELEKEKLEAEKPITELTYEDDQVSITVKADQEGNIPKGASLKVTPIQKTEIRSDMDADAKAEAEAVNAQYDETAEKLSEKAEGEDYDILGFLAYDISFVDENDAKLEPAGSVSVTMDYKEAAIPDEVKEAKENGAEISDVTLMHLEENDQGEVKDVVDMVADESQTAEVKTTEATEVEKAEFKTESFSVFTLTWHGTAETSEENQPSLQVKVVDTTGAEIGNGVGDVTITEATAVSEIAKQIVVNGTFQKATLGSIKGTEISQLCYLTENNESAWQYSTSEASDTWTAVGENSVYFIYSTNTLSDLNGDEVTATAHAEMMQNAEQGSLPISWTRYQQYNYKADNKYGTDLGLWWKWSDVTDHLNEVATNNSNEVWDGSRLTSHNYNVYLNQNVITAVDGKLYDSATWATEGGAFNDSMNRFKGTFDLKDLQLTTGYDYQDYDYTIKSVVDEDRVYINDNVFVFIYPEGTELSDKEDSENYFGNYLAFWTGNSNRKSYVNSDGIRTFAGKNGTIAYNNTSGSIITEKEDNKDDSQNVYCKVTDGWYAKPVVDGAGAIIQRELGKNSSNTKFCIDVITHDNWNGGGMYRLIINATRQNKTPVSFYKVDADNTNQGIKGAKFTLTDVANPDTSYEFTSTATGQTDTYYLKDGTYTLTETEAPDGYESTINQWTVTVANDTFTITAETGSETDENAAFGQFRNTGDNRDGCYFITNKKTSTPDPGPNPDGGEEPVHTKTIEKKGTNDYRLTLTVKGEVGDATPIDVLLIVDKSSSMTEAVSGSNKNRMEVTKNAISTLVNTLKNSSAASAINIAMVTFGRTAEDYQYKSKTWNAITDVTSGENYVDALTANSSGGGWGGNSQTGTNWQAGVDTGNSVMERGRENAKKYVIFLTDGEPTRYGTKGESGNDTRDFSQAAYDAAVTAWNKDGSKLKNAAKYIIDVTGSENQHCKNFAGNNTSGVNATYLKGTSRNDIESAFNTIAKDITQKTYTNVSITDTLSEYADFADDDKLKLKVYKKDADGRETVLTENTDYTLELDRTNKTITISSLNNGQALEDGVTYYVEFNIKPTDKAYAEYAINGGYTQTGDANTDTNPEKITSSGKSGWHSNSEATVSYTVNNENKSAEYKHPVLQVDAEKVSHKVVKKWEGGTEDSVQVKLVAKYDPYEGSENGQENSGALLTVPNTYKAFNATSFQAVTLSGTSNQWTYTWQNLPKYYYYVDASGTTQKREIQYSVVEVNPSEKYTVTYTEDLDTDEGHTPLTTITNTAKAKWKLVKVSTNSDDVKLGGAEFTLTDTQAASGDGAATGATVIYYGVSAADTGVVSWYSDKAHETAIDTIPTGTYTLKETKAPGGYAVNEDSWNITVGTDGGWTVTNESGQSQTAFESKEEQENSEGNKTEITVKSFYFADTPAYALPSTGGIGTHWYTISGILLMLGAALMLYRYKKQ